MPKRNYVHYLVAVSVMMFIGWSGCVLYKYVDLESTHYWTPTQAVINKADAVQKTGHIGKQNTYVYLEPKIWVSYKFMGTQYTQIMVDTGYDQISQYGEIENKFPIGGSLRVLVDPDAPTKVRSVSYLERTLSVVDYAIWAVFAALMLLVFVMRGSWLRAADMEDEAVKVNVNASPDIQKL